MSKPTPTERVVSLKLSDDYDSYDAKVDAMQDLAEALATELETETALCKASIKRSLIKQEELKQANKLLRAVQTVSASPWYGFKTIANKVDGKDWFAARDEHLKGSK